MVGEVFSSSAHTTEAQTSQAGGITQYNVLPWLLLGPGEETHQPICIDPREHRGQWQVGNQVTNSCNYSSGTQHPQSPGYIFP